MAETESLIPLKLLPYIPITTASLAKYPLALIQCTATQKEMAIKLRLVQEFDRFMLVSGFTVD